MTCRHAPRIGNRTADLLVLTGLVAKDTDLLPALRPRRPAVAPRTFIYGAQRQHSGMWRPGLRNMGTLDELEQLPLRLAGLQQHQMDRVLEPESPFPLVLRSPRLLAQRRPCA